ncbi:membrane protein [Microbacterium phage Big4]|nr:membrane protein [Microbacterium phage Big4]
MINDDDVQGYERPPVKVKTMLSIIGVSLLVIAVSILVGF